MSHVGVSVFGLGLAFTAVALVVSSFLAIAHRQKWLNDHKYDAQRAQYIWGLVAGQAYGGGSGVAGSQQVAANAPQAWLKNVLGGAFAIPSKTPSQAACSAPKPVSETSWYPFSFDGTEAMATSFPLQQDPSSVVIPTGACSPVQPSDSAMNIDALMPQSWRKESGAGAGSLASDAASCPGQQWAKYAPTKESFSRYLVASGSARLSMNSRSPYGRIIGEPGIYQSVRPGAPTPISASPMLFSDSSIRQGLVHNQTGVYPKYNSGC